MNKKKYNAQRQGNEDHLHVQDELNKPEYKKAIAKEKVVMLKKNVKKTVKH